MSPLRPEHTWPSPVAGKSLQPRCFGSFRLALVTACVAFAAGAATAGPGSDAPRAGTSSSGKLSPPLARHAIERPDDPVVVWVYFSDRAGRDRDPAAFDEARRAMNPRALERRVRRGALADLVAADLPVHAPYVHALVARGARLRGVSRWLNAASIEAPGRLAAELTRMPFVERIEFVPRGVCSDPPGETEVPAEGSVPAVEHGPLATESSAPPPAIAVAPGDTAYYGASFRQLAMMQVPQLHAQGLTGAGVLVCMLDAGFHTTHRAFSSLNVLARRDFIHGDTNVDYDATQDSVGQAGHGTLTLSCVAGTKPGTFSGVAFGATVALGKTEWVPTETPVEMDYWQFGAEWADSLGADVISSSLGYSEFDLPNPSYTYADMDGRTTVVTRAAVEAARRGITVVNAAGNSGSSPWHYIIAPGDADSIVTSGAVDSFNVVTSFSSRGPTSDGRIKPDVTAMGSRVFMVSTGTDSTYSRASGTSFSTPLTAGVVALLLEAHPYWRPFEVREALRSTALNHLSPDNNIGWGLVQALEAKNWTPSTTEVGAEAAAGSRLALSASPNPARSGVGAMVRFAAPGAARVTLDVSDLAGRRVARLYDGPAATPRAVRWEAASLPAGIYWIRMSAHAAGVGAESRAIRIALIR